MKVIDSVKLGIRLYLSNYRYNVYGYLCVCVCVACESVNIISGVKERNM